MNAVRRVNRWLLLGLLVACIAGVALGLIAELWLAFVIAAAVCVVYAALVWALWVGNPLPGLLLIVGATSATGAVCVLLIPALTIFASAAVYLAACIATGVWTRAREAARLDRLVNHCAKCGYLLAGIPSGAPCPECGFSDPYRLLPTRCVKCGGSLVGLEPGAACPGCKPAIEPQR